MVDTSAKHYEVPEVPDDWQFELLGHTDHGLDRFPQWVVPIGILEGRGAAIYNQREINGVIRAAHIELPPTPAVMYDQDLRERLSGFDFRNHRLFAYADDDVVFHDYRDTLEFARGVLADERFKDTNIFVRAAIANESGDRELILGELRRCVRYFGSGTALLKAWYEAEIDMIRRPKDKLGYGLPEVAAELAQPGMLESLMGEQ